MDYIKKDIELLKQKIEDSENIYLMAHVNPDGDAIGSTLALGTFIKENMNKNVNIVLKDKIPSNFKFMPNSELIKKNIQEDRVDLLITLDCASIDRLGLDQDTLDRMDYIINIDHHVTNTRYGVLNIVDDKASATGEVVYGIIEDMNYDISKEIATCLYVSISTDTGSFKYTNTTSKTHFIASKLLEKNIDLETINVEIYQNRSIEQTKLLTMALNNLKLYNHNKIGIISIDNEILDLCGAKVEDAESIVNFIRDIDTVEVACVIREIESEMVRVSLRAKREVDVSKVALKFDGGGHTKAAGCTIYQNIKKAEEMIIEEINKLFR